LRETNINSIVSGINSFFETENNNQYQTKGKDYTEIQLGEVTTILLTFPSEKVGSNQASQTDYQLKEMLSDGWLHGEVQLVRERVAFSAFQNLLVLVVISTCFHILQR